MDKKTKNIIVLSAVSVAVIAIGAAVGKKAVQKARWKRGKKDRDSRFNPDKQIKVAYVGEQGYANVRSTPKLMSGGQLLQQAYKEASWWDIFTGTGLAQQAAKIDNLLGQVKSGKIGLVVDEALGDDGFGWYKVNLIVPLKGQSYGWVREDVAQIKFEDK